MVTVTRNTKIFREEGRCSGATPGIVFLAQARRSFVIIYLHRVDRYLSTVVGEVSVARDDSHTVFNELERLVSPLLHHRISNTHAYVFMASAPTKFEATVAKVSRLMPKTRRVYSPQLVSLLYIVFS